MNAIKSQDNNPTETDATICHICNKGSLVIVNTFGIEPRMLECSACGTRFYKNATGELKEIGSEETTQGMKKNIKNKKPGKPFSQKYEK
jgi:hypothetical protein